MTNQLQANSIKFNEQGNQIVDEKIDGGGKTQTIKYGLIKLASEREERRVSFKTLLAIIKAREDGTESVMIRELNMAVKTTQIMMMRSETETIRTVGNISNLPTANLILTEQFQISGNLRSYFVRNKISYYEAVVHYVKRDGARQYYLDMDKIKRLVKVDFDDDGYDYVSAIYHYGVKQ